MRHFRVGVRSAGKRADVFVASKFREFSRSSLVDLFKKSKVLINNKPAKPGFKLRVNDVVKVEDELINTQSEEIELPVIYEDENVIVINKPAGVLTHSKGALNLEPTVASFVRTKINDKLLIGNRAGIVHRLDRFTSGVIICAKNSAALKYLQNQFATRKVEKIYLAVVDGVPEPKEAVIDVPIARNPRRPQTFIVSSVGKIAITRYKLLKKLNRQGSFSLLELEPQTGRTHQIRVHLAYISHPIMGDNIYGSNGGSMLLHASKLKLRLPDGEVKIFSAPLPESFIGVGDE